MITTGARRGHAIVVAAFAACGVIQVFLAGLGVFADPGAFVSHREFGYLFGWLTLVALVLALVGRLPRRLIGATVLLLVLFAMQSVLVALRAEMPAVAALHPVNGFAIIGLAVATARASWRVRDAPAPAAVAAADLGAPAPSGID
ncbi:MAG TPA: DUF6220 domain-containing protein [Candidatus Limnocylindrales bacterium]|jgi:hypothetical protein